MEVVFLKNHLHYKKGLRVNAEKAMAEYWIKVGVCKKAPAKKAAAKKVADK